jgi:hypothetical protein
MSRGEFSVTVRRIVVARADGCCEGCGALLVDPFDNSPIAPHSFQHRRARGMGGRRDPITAGVQNALLWCGSGVTGCHGWAERHPHAAKAKGWAVSHHADPRDIPADVHGYGLVYLTEGGTYLPAVEAS